jgi:hypothetical protein
VSRAAINTALLAAPGVSVDQVWAANALDTPTAWPFIMHRWEETAVAFGLVGTETVTIWVHDKPGDYSQINAIIAWMKTALTSMVHVDGGDGYIVTCVDWTGESGDLWDDGWETITRNASFRVVSRAG